MLALASELPPQRLACLIEPITEFYQFDRKYSIYSLAFIMKLNFSLRTRAASTAVNNKVRLPSRNNRWPFYGCHWPKQRVPRAILPTAVCMRWFTITTLRLKKSSLNAFATSTRHRPFQRLESFWACSSSFTKIWFNLCWKLRKETGLGHSIKFNWIFLSSTLFASKNFQEPKIYANEISIDDACDAAGSWKLDQVEIWMHEPAIKIYF